MFSCLASAYCDILYASGVMNSALYFAVQQILLGVESGHHLYWWARRMRASWRGAVPPPAPAAEFSLPSLPSLLCPLSSLLSLLELTSGLTKLEFRNEPQYPTNLRHTFVGGTTHKIILVIHRFTEDDWPPNIQKFGSRKFNIILDDPPI